MQSYNDLNIDYQGGDLLIYSKKLVSLVGCPEVISGGFNCSDNKLASLVGGPTRVSGYYRCYNNNLTDLVGCASYIGGDLICWANQITSLIGIHKIIKSCRGMFFDDCTITQGGIGLLLIENLTNISSDGEPFKIIYKYLGQGTKGMMACRAELISRGYDDYAKL